MSILNMIIVGITNTLSMYFPFSRNAINYYLINVFHIEECNNIQIKFAISLGLFIVIFFFVKDLLLSIIQDVTKKILGILLSRNKEVKKNDTFSKFIIYVLISFVLSVFIKLLLTNKVESTLISNAFGILFMGIILLVKDKTKRSYRYINDMRIHEPILIGVLSGFSTLPGFSYIAILSFIFIFLNFDKEFSIKYINLLLFFNLLIDLVVNIVNVIDLGFDFSKFFVFIIVLIITIACSIFSIKTFNNLFIKRKMKLFSYISIIISIISFCYFYIK